MSFTEIKGALKSKTILATLVSVIAGGVDVYRAIKTGGDPTTGLTVITAGLAAILGRLVAKKKIEGVM